jgi:hypothetical protein
LKKSRSSFVNHLYQISINLDTGCLAQHIYLQNQPRGVFCPDDNTLQIGQRSRYNPAELARLDVPVWHQRSTRLKRVLNPHQLAKQFLLVFDLYYVRHTIGSQNFKSVVLVTTKKQISAEQRQERTDFPAPMASNPPTHWEKIVDTSADQIVRKSFLIPAFGMGNPPPTFKITDSGFFRPCDRRIFVFLEQFDIP